MSRPPVVLPRNKSFKSALILYLPSSHPLYASVQRIRSEKDRHYRRWPMPHITLLYPFAPYGTQHWQDAMQAVRKSLASHPPFKVSLGSDTSPDSAGLGIFQHSCKSSTLFLRPHPELEIQRVVHALLSSPVLTEYHDTLLHPPNPLQLRADGLPPTLDEVASTFRPHLSLGQWAGSADAVRGIEWCSERLDKAERVLWDVSSVVAIKREGFHGSFEVMEEVPLGGVV